MTARPIACNLTALTEQERNWLITGFATFFSRTTEITARPDGYGFKIPNADFKQTIRVAKLVALNRLCCPFIKHEIVQEPGTLDLWLYMSGPAGVKQAVKADIMQLASQDEAFMRLLAKAG